MPQTLEGTTFAFFALVVLAALCAYGTRRWGTGPRPDPVIVAWRSMRSRPTPGAVDPWSMRTRATRDVALLAVADDDGGGRRRRWFKRRRGDDEVVDEPQPTPERDAAGEPAPDVVDEEASQQAPTAAPPPSDPALTVDEDTAPERPSDPSLAVEEGGAPDEPVDAAVGVEEDRTPPSDPAATVTPAAPAAADTVWEAHGTRAPVQARAEEPPVVPSARPKLDHVPFADGDGTGADADGTRWRGRFRQGLRKTRDFLNRDVREVFGAGPVAESFDALEEVLVRADVGVSTATALSDALRERGRELTSDTLPQALKQTMRSMLGEADRKLHVNTDGVSVWLVVGVNGTGKTTTIAKLARHADGQGFRTLLAAADTYRAAAIEQLQTWGERLGIEVVRQQAGSDPAAVAFDAVAHAKARGYDLVIVDTAGRLHTRTPLMEELRKVRRVIDRDPGLITETLLVLDATTGQNGLAQAKAFTEAVEVTGLVLAKLDGTAKGGITFAVERELGIPVKAVGTGEQATDLAPFDPDEFVDDLFD